MKTQKNRLFFEKNSITELNDQQSLAINGGTDTTTDNPTDGDPTGYVCSNCVTHTGPKLSVFKPSFDQ